MKTMTELEALANQYLQQLPALMGVPKAPLGGEIASFIDHTILKADATEAQIRKLCAEATENNFAAVCINPAYVALCNQLLKGSGVAVCTVIGFPLGANPTEIKVAETEYSVRAGATEVDLVINIGAMRSGHYQLVYDEIVAVKKTAGKALLKVIFENCYLEKKEKILACLMCKEAGAEYVKTSTGFGSSGATLEDVELMRRVVGHEMGVKAAGGIRTHADALKMIASGASRIGTSAGVAIMAEAKA